MNNGLKTTISKEERKKTQLQQSILRKQKILEGKIERVEMLKEELSLIEHEYSVRIGALLEKDNKLDLEIMKQKNINEQLDKGISFEEAIKREKDFFYNEMLSQDEENTYAKENVTVIGKQVSKKTLLQIKTLWKRLIVKFHPDLVTDKDEKTEREEIVKKLNKAYREHNLEALIAFEGNIRVDQSDQTIEKLENLLIEIENMITKVDLQYQKLKESEWFSWREKMRKAARSHLSKGLKEDVFLDLEKSLIDDILQKIAILKKEKSHAGQSASVS